MLGIGTDKAWLPDWFLMVMFGFVDTITILFLTLIGPLLVAAQYRQSFEVSMGGTITSVCVGVPFVLKQVLENIPLFYLPTLSRGMSRGIVLGLVMLSSFPFVPLACRELKEILKAKSNLQAKNSSQRSSNITMNSRASMKSQDGRKSNILTITSNSLFSI